MQKRVDNFIEFIKIDFQNLDLIKNAFVHRSYLNENRGFPLPSNERLEFLGDACLELIVSEYLYEKFPNEPEGILTSYRGSLVNTDSLAESAKGIRLGDYLFLSKGEEEGGGRKSNYLLANTFEAVIGAIYLDQGYEPAKTFVSKYVICKLPEIIAQGKYKDPKSLFQEMTQENFSITPSYEIINETGPDHQKEFQVVAKLNRNIVGQGQGASKQKAELSAAENAISQWNKILKEFTDIN